MCEGVSRREDSFDLFFLDNPVIIGQTEVFFSLLLYLGKDTRKSIRKIKKFPQYKEKNSVARLQSIRTGNIYIVNRHAHHREKME